MRPSKVIFLIIISAVFSCISAQCQIESLTDAQIPCNKVLAIDGDVAVGCNHSTFFKTLKVFSLKNGNVISTIEKKLIKEIRQNEIHYFLLQEQGTSEGELYYFQEGALIAVDYDQTIFNIFKVPGINSLVGTTSQGFVLISNGILIEEVIIGAQVYNIKSHAGGYMAITKGSYFLLDSGFSIIETYEFPSGLSSFGGEEINGILLLSGDINEENQRPLSLYNIETSELYSVVDSSGNEALPNFFAVPRGLAGNHFFIAGSYQINPAQYTYTHPTEAAFINPVNGIYTPANFRPQLYQNLVQPTVVESANGPVVFGRMGFEGIEPYSIRNQKIEILKDIYPGYGGSLELLVENPANLGNQAIHLNVFDLVEKDGIVFFAAQSPFLGAQIWRTDGTHDGTYALTEIEIERKGFEECYLSLDDGQILLTILYRDETRKLYALDDNAKPVFTDLNKDKNWEASYVRNPESTSGTVFRDGQHPGVHLAKDGTSVLVLNRTDMWQDVISYNHKWALPSKRIQGFYARTVIQTINADGSLRSSATIRANENEQRTVGRSFDSGHIYALVSHSPSETWVNEVLLSQSQKGHYLIELDNSGNEIKSTFIPTGGKDRIRISNIEVTNEGIYVLGMADRNFDLNGVYSNDITAGNLRAVLLKFNLNHELVWIADSGQDQYVFGSGLQSLVVGDESVFLSSGGTSYSVTSSCAFSSWPYVIAGFNKYSGDKTWRQVLFSTDVTRITNMVVINEQSLWLAGYSRGDLTLGNRQLDLISNYFSCGYNDFLVNLDAQTGTVRYLGHTDPSRQKFVQDIQFNKDHLYTLSMVYEEDSFLSPIYETNNHCTLQLDKYTSGGLKVDSLIWPTSIFRSSLGSILKEVRFGFDIHPDKGIVLAGNEIANGTLDGFYSPSCTDPGYYLNSWLMQRREIDDLENATLEPVASKENEFRIYPNPVTDGSFVLDIPTRNVSAYNQLIITDIQGRPCVNYTLNGTQSARLIHLDENLANGVYIVQLIGNSKSISNKLVLQR